MAETLSALLLAEPAHRDDVDRNRVSIAGPKPCFSAIAGAGACKRSANAGFASGLDGSSAAHS